MSDTRDGLWVPARRAMTIGLVLLVTLIAFEALAVNTALPAAEKELGSLGLYGWVFSAFMLATVASIAVSGQAVDERGMAPVLAVGSALFCVGLAIGGAASSMTILVGARVIQGLGAGAISSVANIAIGRAYPPKLRAAMLAVMSTSWVLPGLIGPGASALITTSLGWRWVFAGLLPVVIVATLLTMPALAPFGPIRERGSTTILRRGRDPLLVAIGAAFVISGLSHADRGLPLVLVALGAGVGGTALARLSPAGTFRLRSGTPAAIVLMGLISCAFFGADAFMPLAVNAVRHQSVGFAGLALTTGSISWTVGAWITARTTGKVAVSFRIRVGFGCVIAGIALLIVGIRTDAPLIIFPAAWLVAGLGMGLGYQGIALVVLGGGTSATDDGGVEGPTVAAQQMFNTLGAAIGAGICGACVATMTTGRAAPTRGLTAAFATMGVIALVGALAAGRVAVGASPVGAAPASSPQASST